MNQSRQIYKDEGLEIMIKLQKGDDAESRNLGSNEEESNTDNSAVEDGSEDSKDEDSDQVVALMGRIMNC